MSALIGPRFPATPMERQVMRDFLLEKGFQPPWPIQEKPMKTKGSVIAARAAELMSKMASANAVLAGLEEKRTAAEVDLKAAQEELEAMGINSLYDITRVQGSQEYPVCQEPNCKAVNLSYWRGDAENWRCDAHQAPEPKPKLEAMPAQAKEPAF